jgi:hypothetical protein
MNTLRIDFKKSLHAPLDLFKLGTHSVNTVGEKVSRDPKGSQVVAGVTSAMVVLNTAIEGEKSNPYTVRIHEQDAERDDILFAIRDTLKSNTHGTKSSDERVAAKELLVTFNAHMRRLSSMGLNHESSAVQYLLSSLATEDNKTRATLCGIDQLIADLSRVQKNIDTLCAERTRLEPELSRFTLKNATRVAIRAIQRFLGYVDALAAGDDPEATAIENEVRCIIAEVEALARSRRTKSGNDTHPETTVTLENAA